jgi:hypothetical protein
MRRITRWLCLLFLLLPTLARAQDATTTPAPWPPDPRQLFAPGVEILKTEILPPEKRYLTLPKYDNKKRVVHVYNEQSDTWNEYPYPPDIDENGFTGNIQSYDASTLLLSTYPGQYERNSTLSNFQWLLDVRTGQFTRAQLTCGVLKAPRGKGIWIVDTREDSSSICNTETGEEVKPSRSLRGYKTAEASPDKSRVVLFTFGGDVYSYEFSSQKVLKLGKASGEDRSVNWIDNHRFFIRSTNALQDMTYPWVNFYLADAAQENSLEFATQTFKPAEITSRENPRRYEWVDYRDDECFLKELNWETGVIREFKLDGVCDIGQVINDGSNDRLYYQLLGRIGDDGIWYPYTAELVRFNPFTGYRQELLKGEIEWVENISPDGKFAVVLLDDDGCFEAYPREDQDARLPPCTPQKASAPRHVIIDLKTGKQIYQRPTEWYETGYDQWYDHIIFFADELSTLNALDVMSAGPVDSLLSIGGPLFLYARQIEFKGYDDRIKFHLLDFGASPVSELMIGEATKIRYLPESQQLLVYLPDKRNSADLYDLATHTRHPFIADAQNYDWLEVKSAAKGTLTVIFTPQDANRINGQLDSVERVRYTIRLPSGN